MKSLQFYLINALTLLIGLGLMSGSFSSRDAQAARKDSVPRIQVQQLGGYHGQYLTVYYASGTKPFLGQSATLSQVKTVRTNQISSDISELPALDLPRAGFQPGYNLLVLVVSPTPEFSWVNPDQTSPNGINLTANHNVSRVRIFTRTQVESLYESQGLQQGLILTL